MRTLIIFLILMTSAYGEVLKRNADGDFILNQQNFKVSQLLADYAALMSYNLSVTSEFQDENFTVQGLPVVKKEQMENYVSILLSQSGNAVIRMPESQFMQVISARDIRFTAVPIYKTLDEIPKNDNQAQFSYSLKYIDGAEVARNMRPFLSRYGRIIDIKHANAINISDSGNNLRKLANIIISLDTEEFQKSRNEIQEINEKHKQALKKEKSFFEIVTSNQIIFIFIFFLMGIIFGFGTRGYMMKKVEGGW
jgi:type II secretory pathway component GspD/PulD (secretin)